MRINRIKKILYIALFAALISVFSLIAIPFPIPLTLQIFGIFLALMLLGGASGAASVTLYVALGVIGLPVFAGFGSGFGYILGASGGFIIAFPPASLIFLSLEAAFGKGERKGLVYSFIAMIFIYLSGALWFSYVYSGGSGFIAALTVCVIPYIIPDVIKILLAFYLSKRIKKIISLY